MSLLTICAGAEVWGTVTLIQADGREGLGVGQGARWRVPAQSGERGEVLHSREDSDPDPVFPEW